MKKSVGTSRSSKGPVRISVVGAVGGAGGRDAQARPSLRMSTSRIPVKKTRSSSIDNNPQLALDRQSRSSVKDFSGKPMARGHSAAGRPSATPCGTKQPGKGILTPLHSGQRRSQSAHSAEKHYQFTPSSHNILVGIAAGKKTDLRPINDKQFQYQAMTRVFNYTLVHRGNFSNISLPKPGKPGIMIKSFYDLMSLLLVKIFPSQTVNGANYVELIPFLMKKLHYPGNMTTSWLRSANTIHAWPHVVAMLSWLVDLISNIMSTDGDVEDGVTFGNGDKALYTPSEMFDYQQCLFEPWNHGDKKHCDALEEEFLNSLQSRTGITENDIKEAQLEVQKLEDELNDPEDIAAIDHENHLTETLKKLRSNEKMVTESIETGKQAIQTLIENREVECHKQASLAKNEPLLRNKLGEMRHIIATQKMSRDHVDEIRKEWSAMEAEMDRQSQYKENIEKIQYKSMVKSGGLQKKLENLRVDHNTALLTLGLKNPEQVQLNMETKLANSLEEWQQTEKNLHHLLQMFNEALEKTDKQLNEVECQAQEKKEEDEKYRTEIANLAAEENSLKKQLEMLKSECAKNEKKIRQIIERTEAEIKEILKSDVSPSKMAAKLQAETERVTKCAKELQEFQEEGRAFLIDYKAMSMQAMEDAYDDKMHLLEALHELEEKMKLS